MMSMLNDSSGGVGFLCAVIVKKKHRSVLITLRCCFWAISGRLPQVAPTVFTAFG